MLNSTTPQTEMNNSSQSLNEKLNQMETKIKKKGKS